MKQLWPIHELRLANVRIGIVEKDLILLLRVFRAQFPTPLRCRRDPCTDAIDAFHELKLFQNVVNWTAQPLWVHLRYGF